MRCANMFPNLTDPYTNSGRYEKMASMGSTRSSSSIGGVSMGRGFSNGGGVSYDGSSSIKTRSYLPETWLWDLLAVYVLITVFLTDVLLH